MTTKGEGAIRLHIMEKFEFSDGTTVLVGKLEGEAKVIGRGTALLWTDGRPAEQILVLGERMPGPARPDLRGVYTSQRVAIDVKSHQCILVWSRR
jgi:hypothetical protein